MGAFAKTWDDGGVRVVSAAVNGFALAELRFPPGHVQHAFEPERPYLAVVLEGSLVKTFARSTLALSHAHAVTMPAGATHGARFGPDGAAIAIVKPAADVAAACFRRVD